MSDSSMRDGPNVGGLREIFRFARDRSIDVDSFARLQGQYSVGLRATAQSSLGADLHTAWLDLARSTEEAALLRGARETADPPL